MGADSQALATTLAEGTVCTPGTPQHAAGDDYPWPDELTDEQGGTLSTLGYYHRECVDFVAWRMNRDTGVTQAPWRWTWATLTPGRRERHRLDRLVARSGLGASPRSLKQAGSPGGGTSVGAYGHVAYVQSVLPPDGKVVLEEYNWGRTHKYGTRVVSASDVDYFLAPPPR